MLINVPQYIDVEDKIAGPLTVKQLGWVMALGIILLILWNVLSKPLFFITGIPLAILFVALAFYRPYNQSFGSFLMFAVLYFFRPKVYFWKRTAQKNTDAPQKVQVVENRLPERKMTAESLSGLAQLLDSEGMQHREGIEEILKKMPSKK